MAFAFTCIINALGASAADLQAQSIADDIISFKLEETNSTDIQSWIDTDLTQNAGTSEWYVLALRKNCDHDFSSYKSALEAYVDSTQINSAVSLQKYALVLALLGSESAFLNTVADDTIGTQGVMSYVFGLHLLNNGAPSSNHTAQSVVQNLLDLQLDDGGWAVMGNVSDSDVTAMALQALALYYQDNNDVKAAVDKALDRLSQLQNNDGGFSSYGIPNSESTSQVIIALSILGINAQSDARFIKNGNTAFSALENYKLPNGSFSHEVGGEYNAVATVQALCAAQSYLAMSQNGGNMYYLSADSFDDDTAEQTTQTTTKIQTATQTHTTTTSNFQNTDDSANTESLDYKPIAIGVVAAIAALVCVVLVVLKKRSIKNFAAVIIAAVIAILIIIFTDIKSADDYYNGKAESKPNAIGTVAMSVECKTVSQQINSDYISADGIILDNTEFTISDGDTVYDILIEAARLYNIQVENNGTDSMAYISGINYLYEFDFGDLSGWMFFVNGEKASTGCSDYILSNGDVIEWRYTCSMGEDLQ